MDGQVEIFYARSMNPQGKQQTVQEHLGNVSRLCSSYLEPIDCTDAGKILGEFHDFGKYSQRFADVLQHRATGVNHAFPGAALLWNMYHSRYPVGADILATVAAAHHGTVKPFNDVSARNCLQGVGNGRDSLGSQYSLFGINEIQNAVSAFQREVSPSGRRITLPVSSAGNQLEKMLCVRMLLSALADADYTDAAAAFDADYINRTKDVPLDASAAMERLLTIRAEKKKNSSADSALNRLRDNLFEDCLKAGAGEPGMYTLTAPTGLGKTLSLMAFALNHCITHPKMRRVILLLPFLAIARQNADDYRKIISGLLESHSAVEWTDETRLLSERWSAPCIITTNVGFFEPLFADSAVDVRRLHQIANSVIVLDEAQSLPPALLDSTLKTVRALCKNYGCTFVFSTATQPHFAYRPGLGDGWSPTEIVPDPQALFNATRRVRFDWRIPDKTPFDDVARELADHPTGCVIVNLRKHAAELYDAVCRYRNPDEVFMLSTDLCQAHREQVIQTIRDRLSTGIPTLLISTQCIEAGVDLDFPVLFRALAPLESIIQAAGRVNRNGKMPGGGQVVVFIPDVPANKTYPKGEYYQYAANCVLTLLSRHPIDCSDLSHINEYYELLYTYGSGDKPALLDSIRMEDYESTAKAYRMIESGGVQVIVPWPDNEDAMELYRSIKEQYDKKGLTPGLLADARPITVTSFDVQRVQKCCVPLYYRSWERNGDAATQWYLLGIPENYDSKKGLALSEMSDEFIY